MAEFNIVGCVVKERAIVGAINKGVGMGELPQASGLSEFLSPAYSVNGTDLAAVQTAISEKSGVASPAFPDGFVRAVEGIEGPTEVFFTNAGSMYQKEMRIADSANGELVKEKWSGASEMESFYSKNLAVTISATYVFRTCTKLKTAVLEKMKEDAVVGGVPHYFFMGCTALQTAVLGSIGSPVNTCGTHAFRDCTQAGLTITMYVNASTLADIPSNVTSSAPWGATNATIIYRNSNTGEVITE